MQILVTGGTGFIGQHLVRRLESEGHSVAVATRSPARAAPRLGPNVTLIDITQSSDFAESVGRADAVVNLAGESVVGGRWTANRKRVLRDSRIQVTETLVQAMRAAETPPEVLVSASAIGIYGDSGDQRCIEDTPPAADFLAQLCVDWEAAALEALELGVRVVLPRIGVVLGPDGGALDKMLPAFRLGMGGVIGSGQQYFSWIHIEDMVRLLCHSVSDRKYRGPFNATAPHPVRNYEFTKTLGRVLKRPTAIPVPSFALKAALGEASTTILGGQRVFPEQVQAWGFEFNFPEVAQALSNVLASSNLDSVRGAPQSVS
ncbi:MAG: TIGR01777 family oxidoreductase [Myxococcota bacterium]|nr:TIGR01777 family oxidoreductase [Myxococcota bacterium]